MINYKFVMWKDAANSFPDVEVREHVFYWSGAVFQHLEDWLFTVYMEDDDTHDFMEKSLPLPCIRRTKYPRPLRSLFMTKLSRGQISQTRSMPKNWIADLRSPHSL